MRVAQGLYEEGYITYMRTDSTTLSDTALTAARQVIEATFGREYLTDAPRTYAKKSKNAQEAHEAIRPSGDTFRSPDAAPRRAARRPPPPLRADLAAHARLADARRPRQHGHRPHRRHATSDRLERRRSPPSGRRRAARSPSRAGRPSTATAATTTPTRPATPRPSCPALDEGQALPDPAVEADGHTTQPPSRYTEATLVKALEERGIGRPSTYASIMQTIQDRGYVWKKGQALVPTSDAFAVVNLLEQPLQRTSSTTSSPPAWRTTSTRSPAAASEREPWLHKFWFGNGTPGVKGMKEKALDEADAEAINTIPLGVDEDGEPIVVAQRPLRAVPEARRGHRVGPRGPAPRRAHHRAGRRDPRRRRRAASRSATDPATGLPVFAKSGRFGPYVQLGDADTLPPDTKPRMSSLFKTMALVDDHARRGAAAAAAAPGRRRRTRDGGEIVAANGRYGPSSSGATRRRSLDAEEQLFTVTLDEAVTVLAQPKQFGRRRAAPAPPLKELGNDPVSGQPIVVKDGRFGPVRHRRRDQRLAAQGRHRRGVTIERAAELLQIRRDAGPTKKTAAKKKAPAKKAPAKKTAAEEGAGQEGGGQEGGGHRSRRDERPTEPAPTPDEPVEGVTEASTGPAGDEPTVPTPAVGRARRQAGVPRPHLRLARVLPPLADAGRLGDRRLARVPRHRRARHPRSAAARRRPPSAS